MIDPSNAPAASNPADGAEPEKKWYVLKVTSNREKSIRDNLIRRIKREGFEQYFGEIKIPTEKVAETKNGKKKVTEKKLYPGYLFIEMELNEETWFLIRETSGVGDFTGSEGKPIPMQAHEIEKTTEPVRVKIALNPGDTVKIKEGAFESFEGTVDAIDEGSGKIKVLIEIFGRSTECELEYWQVETV
jgi:transcriptional antiterminator NusG